MGAHMKKRILPVIIAILLILVIAGGALGKVLLDKYSYSKEEADWNEFYAVFSGRNKGNAKLPLEKITVG